MRLIILLFLIVVLMAACNSAVQEWEAAQRALVDYFSALSQEQYSKAVALYGGSYESLIAMNPDENTFDLEGLWQNGCTLNGLQCLPVRSATLKEQGDNTFVFTVEFSNPDGSRFVLGPCCGADATQMPPMEKFTYQVVKKDGRFLVMDLPVYLP
jgi:hypothetical protein